MTQPHLRVMVVSPEEADDGMAEFWSGPDLMAVTVIVEGQLHLRIETRADGQPWLIDTASLGHGLIEAARLLAEY